MAKPKTPDDVAIKIRRHSYTRAKIAAAISGTPIKTFISDATDTQSSEILKRHTKNLPEEATLATG